MFGYAFNQLLMPVCLSRQQFWTRLLVLVPVIAVSSFIAAQAVEARAQVPFLGTINLFLLMALTGTLLARLRVIGVRWLQWLGGLVCLFLFPLVALMLFFAVAYLLKSAGLALQPDQFPRVLRWFGDVPIGLFAVLAVVAGSVAGSPDRLIAQRTARVDRAPVKSKAGALVARGAALASLSRYAEAIGDFDRALLLKPDLKLAQRAKQHAEKQIRAA